MSRQERAQHFASRHYEGLASGPLSFLNPTVRRRALPAADPDEIVSEDADKEGKDLEKDAPEHRDEISADDVHNEWRSRDNRKGEQYSPYGVTIAEVITGRHTLAVHQVDAKDANARFRTPPPTGTLRATVKGIVRMFTTYPYWDVSYLVAITFTLGSVIWVINAFFVWLPLEDPSTEFSDEIDTAGGITAFIGATIFEIGSVLLMIEAVNEDRSGCFGWNFERVVEETGVLRLVEGETCTHHHRDKHSFLGKRTGNIHPPLPYHPLTWSLDDTSQRQWTWWPSSHELRTHYFHELGFLACLAQFLGASIFWISGLTALPGINNKLSTPGLNGAYWSPQVIGGTGFIVSSALFMLETQKKWYLPAPTVLGWHIGLWNFIGAIGFTLCGALGYASANSGAVYEGSLATFWGSWAFLIGSVIQWYESLDKFPVELTNTSKGGGKASEAGGESGE
jgi:hypothetical protein